MKKRATVKKILAALLVFFAFGTSVSASAPEHPWTLKRDKRKKGVTPICLLITRTYPQLIRCDPFKKILAALLVFFAFGTSVSASAPEHPWTLKRDKDGIQVSVRKVEGSPFLEYKGVVVVDTPLEEVVRLYEEKEDGRMPEWFHQCREVRLLETKSPEDKLYYFVLWMPPPFETRDLVYRRLRTTDAVKGVVEYRVKALPDAFPRQPKKVRMPSADGYWRLSRAGEGKTEVYYQQHSDMGGEIPAGLVNLLAVEMPYKTLANFRRLLMEEKEKKKAAKTGA